MNLLLALYLHFVVYDKKINECIEGVTNLNA